MQSTLRALGHSKFARIDGFVMEDLLTEFGATQEDMKVFPSFWDKDKLGDDPTYDFRKTTQTRWNHTEGFKNIDRLCRAPFKQNYGENATLHDLERNFPEAPSEFLDSTVTKAFQRIMRVFLKNQSSKSGRDQTKGGLGYISGCHAFRIQTSNTGAVESPTPEGIHQDGAFIVMITYINSQNLGRHACQSRVYSMEQPAGPLDEAGEEEARAKTRLQECNLRTPFETLVLNDREVKHDNLPIKRDDENKDAFRDVLVIWAREFNEADLKSPNYIHPDYPVQLVDFQAEDEKYFKDIIIPDIIIRRRTRTFTERMTSLVQWVCKPGTGN